MSIANEITRLQNAKTSIKTSIENKGVIVGDGTLDTYANKIDEIETGITPTGTINITENGTYDVSDKASANVNVNSGDIKINDATFLFYSSARIDYINELCACITDSNTSCFQMFNNCPSLTTTPQFNTGSVTNMSSMFSNCSKLTTIPQFNTGNVTDMSNMFSNCLKLTTIPQFNTSRVTNIATMFNNCPSLTTIPQFNTSRVTNIYNMFSNCSSLTTLGGFLNLGQAYSTKASANYSNYKLSLSSCTKLTHDSLMNVINNLYDIATKGCNTQQLVLGSTNIAKLTAEEIAIATNKGWTVS